MLYRRDDVAQLYQRIRECSAASPAAVTVLILVSLEADGVVTCAMLTKLLEQDEIPHKVKPIKDYGALGEVFENDIVDDAELRNIVLLQCGAIVDLFDMLGTRLAEMDAERAGGPRSFDETPHPECRFWILDSHRPVAVENATCGERLCVLHDDEPNEDLAALVEQEHILNDPDFQDEEDEDEEDGRPTQRRRLDPSAYAQLSPDSRASQFHAVLFGSEYGLMNLTYPSLRGVTSYELGATVILRESVETEKFTQEQSLTKLALFLADALRETRKNSKEAIPVLIAAPKKDRTHLVVAVLGSARFWGPSGGRNAFGKAFLEAARDPRVKARVAHESFESAVCRVASDDLRNFLEGVALNYDVA
ncbi:hypothetical protein EMIHUDRAFT_463154 [Emiliania huxleyi CCMP1516]|uniref:Uncharacterized protein n=2 Tax=Emiliania huxleyi TaxID=2903 RepID=A0A0D3JYL3_EMIH1|nr:hypothetical protein EMIHUDRAFT_463154 [Emiliania huxleyi CCMP1516]EOD28598.1 hypothetical protein EMIHUDRAFT_463154 [Emiliania huxleyi CCMP1516]|eukprot:XP_005781027.1 hypothetical protein EMIHUDRAFT_463154 [Emiliania huxleyi CCMP1516]